MFSIFMSMEWFPNNFLIKARYHRWIGFGKICPELEQRVTYQFITRSISLQEWNIATLKHKKYFIKVGGTILGVGEEINVEFGSR